MDAGLLLLVLVVAAIAGLLLYLRVPMDAGNVPRDILAMRGKSTVTRLFWGLLPSRAFDQTIRDQAADLPQAHRRPGPVGYTWPRLLGAVVVLVAGFVAISLFVHYAAPAPTTASRVAFATAALRRAGSIRC